MYHTELQLGFRINNFITMCKGTQFVTLTDQFERHQRVEYVCGKQRNQQQWNTNLQCVFTMSEPLISTTHVLT